MIDDNYEQTLLSAERHLHAARRSVRLLRGGTPQSKPEKIAILRDAHNEAGEAAMQLLELLIGKVVPRETK